MLTASYKLSHVINVFAVAYMYACYAVEYRWRQAPGWFTKENFSPCGFRFIFVRNLLLYICEYHFVECRMRIDRACKMSVRYQFSPHTVLLLVILCILTPALDEVGDVMICRDMYEIHDQ